MRWALRALFKAQSGSPITTWRVYERPAKPPLIYPDSFVAAKWMGATPTSDVLTGGTYRELRAKLPVGMTRRDRQPADDPDVLEVWSQRTASTDRPGKKH